MNSFETFEKMLGEAYRDAALLGTGVVAFPATPQPSAPVVACKAPMWCGFDDSDYTDDPRRQVFIGARDDLYGYPQDGRRYCSRECARLPPLVAQPTEACRRYQQGEAGLGECHVCGMPETSHAKPAEQPKPAAKSPAPALVAALDAHARWVAQAAWMAAQTGTPYLGPERLSRPKLAHVAGMHDDDLVGP